MLAKTEKGKEIRKYYVKLENIYNQLIKEEIEEKQKQIEEQKLIQEETKKQLEETQNELKEKDKLIDNLDLRPETEGFNSRESGEIYCIRDNSKPGHLPKSNLTIRVRFTHKIIEYIQKIFSIII